MIAPSLGLRSFDTQGSGPCFGTAIDRKFALGTHTPMLLLPSLWIVRGAAMRDFASDPGKYSCMYFFGASVPPHGWMGPVFGVHVTDGFVPAKGGARFPYCDDPRTIGIVS